MFKATIHLHLRLLLFGNWSERHIQINVQTSFGKSFNMAYGVLMLNTRPFTALGHYKVGC